jgi:hypothetical protein
MWWYSKIRCELPYQILCGTDKAVCWAVPLRYSCNLSLYLAHLPCKLSPVWGGNKFSPVATVRKGYCNGPSRFSVAMWLFYRPYKTYLETPSSYPAFSGWADGSTSTIRAFIYTVWGPSGLATELSTIMQHYIWVFQEVQHVRNVDRKNNLPNIFCQYPALGIFSFTWAELIGIRSTLIKRVLALALWSGPLKGHTKIRTQQHSPWGNSK